MIIAISFSIVCCRFDFEQFEPKAGIHS